MRAEVSRVPEPARQRLIGRLHGEGSFTDTYHELCIAAVLNASDLSIAYEPDLDGRTPDFFVPHDGCGHPLIVEAFTRNRPDEAIGLQRLWWDLHNRLAKVAVPVRLLLVNVPEGEPAITPSVVKRLANELATRLTHAPEAGTYWVDDYRFAVIDRSSNGQTVEFMPPGDGGGATTSDDLIAALRTKVQRYRGVANSRDAHLVVVIAKGPGGAMDESMLSATLRGQNQTTFSLSLYGVGTIASTQVKMRADESPPEFEAALSAAAWLAANDENPPGLLRAHAHGSASRPLKADCVRGWQLSCPSRAHQGSRVRARRANS